MALINAIYATVEISKIMVPPIFIGFFIASFIRASSYLNYLSLPTTRLASISHLPSDCSSAMTLFLVNNWAALAMLSEEHRLGKLGDRELIVAMLVGSIPKGVNNSILYFVPVAISVLGIRTGVIYILLDLSANLVVATAGIFAGRLIFKPRGLKILAEKTYESARWWKRLKPSLVESISSSKKIIKILIPTIFLAQLAIDYILLLPIVEKYNSLIQPFGLSSSSLIVLLASVVSQSAALVACGTLLDNASISPKSCLVLLFIARFLHLGIGFIRIGIPAYVSYFGGTLGIRVAAIEYLLIEVANIAIITYINIFM